ncbi:hypothetical protein ACFSRY_17680 [Pontibacter locisalis]|uniref:Uncharacterized protein n=1 Tax=Pontibacter locisalis TaxID=1719035 RepID=A0ABW5IQW2_9BACT
MFTPEKDTAYECIYRSEFLNIFTNSRDNLILTDWSGVIDASKARSGCMALLESLKKHPYQKVLNNNSKVTGHYPGAIDWVGKVWFPSMYELSVRWFAWVYSPEFYTQISTDVIINLSSRGNY